MGNMHLVTGYKGEAHVSAADMGSLYAAVFGPDTYVLDRGSKLAASVITNNTVRVSDGDLVMQGRHIRLENAADLTIENSAQGYYRHDLIVVRYAKDTSSGQESAELAVLKGTAALTAPEDPSHAAGDILSGAAKAEVPLYRIVLNGLNIEELVPLCAVTGPGGEPGISVYTHNKSGSTHDFVGVGSNGKALIKHTFASGDQIAVNGKVVPAFVGADAVDELPVGRWAFFAFDGAQLNFKGGGGLTNTKLSAATATAADVLSGKTFYAGNKTRKTGDLPVYSNQYIDANSISVKDNLGFAINRGAYTNSNTIYVRKSVSEVADAVGLTADKLVSGQTVLGVTGKAVPMVMASFEINYAGGAGGSTNPAATGCAAYGATKSGTGYVSLPAGTYRVVGHASYDTTEGIGLWVAKQGALGTALKSGTKLDYVQECAIDATLTLSAAATVTVVAHSDTAGHGRRGAVTITKTA